MNILELLTRLDDNIQVAEKDIDGGLGTATLDFYKQIQKIY